LDADRTIVEDGITGTLSYRQLMIAARVLGATFRITYRWWRHCRADGSKLGGHGKRLCRLAICGLRGCHDQL
jgi:hypothetical protein